jgi:hypothetical protein
LRTTIGGENSMRHAATVTSRGATGYRCAPMLSLRKILLATLLLLSLGAPAAHAASDQVSIIMDDDQLLYRGDVISAHTLVTARSLGADWVRATVLWRVVGQGANLSNKEIALLKTKKLQDQARKQRARFKASDPRTYPTRNWDRYDNLVKEAQTLGMRVYFTVTGPGPSYAHNVAPPSQRANAGTYKPKPSQFRAFVQAVGKRYSGTYRDENGTRKALPRVSLWSLWNEPNQPGWLSPQWENGVPASPYLYRELYHAGHQGLELSGHGNDVILLGETSPLGSSQKGPRNGIRPIPFLRELACVAPNGTQYTGPAATARHCDDYARIGPLKASGYAHHPYTKKGAPSVLPTNADDLTIANIGVLGPLLDQLSAQSGGKIPAAMPVLLTEFGYESDPPDPINGIPLIQQARYNELAEFQAYLNPRVKATTQFLIRDAAPVTHSLVTGKANKKGSRAYWFTYQSGLYTLKGSAKPAAFAYAFPFVIHDSGIPGMTGFWGQLRFRPNLVGTPDTAEIFWQPFGPNNKPLNNKPCGPDGWTQQGPPVPTTFRGYFSGAFPTPGPGGEYCALYFDPVKGKITNRSLTVTG